MKEHEIRSMDDLKAALVLESLMAEARRMGAKLKGNKKRVFMRAARIAAEQQNKTKG